MYLYYFDSRGKDVKNTKQPPKHTKRPPEMINADQKLVVV